MKRLRRRITREQYDRAWSEGNGYITEADKKDIFFADELYGYGVYIAR